MLDASGFDASNKIHRNWSRTPASLRQALRGLDIVYYLKTDDEHVKIGTTADIVERLRKLKADWSDVLAFELGSYDLEAERHRQFSHIRVDGCERFRLKPELVQHITDRRAALGVSE